MRKPHFLSYLALLFLIASCAGYKQNIMFKVTDPSAIHKAVSSAESDYVIQKHDALLLDVYTNEGERILDPNFQTVVEGSARTTAPETIEYMVDANGVVKLPLLSEMKLEGLTIRQAEEMLQKEYARFYQQPFVMLKFNNKRVTILGAPGGQVIPITNTYIKLTEVLGLAKGIGNDGKAHNIRVLRGEQVFAIDLSTIQGYLTSDIIIHPGDIIYVEPVRKPFSEGLRDYGPVISIITSIGTLIVVILQANR